MEECGVCKERNSKVQTYEEDIEKEKVRECQKALEREKIAKGLQSTSARQNELQLREVQKLQMLERRRSRQEAEQLELMWHQVLLDDVNRKEEKERHDFERRQQQMLERRKIYDDQIATGHRTRQEAIRLEREKENRRLEKTRQKMEEDYYEAIKRKREQQMTNKINFIEGHEMKLSRLRYENNRDRDIDIGTISVALAGLRKDRQRKIDELHQLQVEKQVFLDNYNRERAIVCSLDEDADNIAREWKQMKEKKADDFVRSVEEDRRIGKEKAAEEYRRHIDERNHELERQRQERCERMERVKSTAYKELQRRFDNANEELRRQMEYRNSLSSQIRENQRVLETELHDIERKDKPFTRKPEMFQDAMGKIARSPCRTSTNPVHPFRRILEQQEHIMDIVQLPLIGKHIM